MTKIIERNVLQAYKESKQRYAIYILRRRVIPSGKDSLKLIHRRIVFAEYFYDKTEYKKVKSASVVGSVMGELHPHGDAAIYDAMKPLSNWWEIMFPLLEPHGNWGNIQGGSQAASRYTETKLSKFCVDVLLTDLKINPNVVDWVETYKSDGTKEPEYLPAKLPLLLINGAFGIAIGLHVYVPRHNICEVIDATIKVALDPETEVVLIPDTCQPCEIIDTNFKAISNKGNGKFVVRGIIEIGQANLPGYKDNPALFIKSTPDLVTMKKVEEAINKMIEDKKLPQVINTFDDSNLKGLNYIIVLKKGADPYYVRDIIYKNTDMQNTYTVNLEILDDDTTNGIVNIEPVRLSYKAYIQYFLEFAKETKFRLYCNDLQQVKTRIHELESYIDLIQSGQVDNIIAVIKQQQTVDDNYLIEYIIANFGLTDLQASFMINNRNKRLSVGYLNVYIEEANELRIKEQNLLEMITNDQLITEEIIKDLLELKDKYAMPRRSKVISESILNDIPQGEFKLVITENNYIKKIGMNDSIGYLKDDYPKFVLKVDNTKNIILFSEKGRAFNLPIHKIPLSDKNSNGTDVRVLVKKMTSNIASVIYEPILQDFANRTSKYFVTILTQNGYIKRMDIEDFLTILPSGIPYIKLDDSDVVKSVTLIKNGLDLIVYSKNKALRMNLEDVPHQKRNTVGLKSMSDGQVDGLTVIKHNTTSVIVVTEKGYVNKFDIVALPTLGRNKNSVSVIKLTKGDTIRGIYTVNDEDILRVITKNNRLEFNVNEIECGSSIGSGNKLINTKTDNIIRCEISHKK